MGFSLLYFIVEDDKIKKIPAAKFDRLWKGDKDESIPEYAGKRLKIAVVVVEYENRKPVDTLRYDSIVLSVNKEGKFNQEEIREMGYFAVNSLELTEPDKPANVIDAAPRFYHKKYHNKYTWLPTEKQYRQIDKLIFKK